MVNTIEDKLNIHSEECDMDDMFKILLTRPDVACDVANYLISIFNKRSSLALTVPISINII